MGAILGQFGGADVSRESGDLLAGDVDLHRDVGGAREWDESSGGGVDWLGAIGWLVEGSQPEQLTVGEVCTLRALGQALRHLQGDSKKGGSVGPPLDP